MLKELSLDIDKTLSILKGLKSGCQSKKYILLYWDILENWHAEYKIITYFNIFLKD